MFVSILGHYSWTFDSPLFRGLHFTAGSNTLAVHGAQSGGQVNNVEFVELVEAKS